MLTLYAKDTCPFCRYVFAAIDRMELDVEIKDIVADEAAAAELVEKGGKRQVPYLIDTENDVAMYESNDIVAYLQKTYGTASADGPRVHNAGDATCVACEG